MADGPDKCLVGMVFLQQSTLIGVVTWKRRGFSAIVLRATLFQSSFQGGDGNGAAVLVARAAVIVEQLDFHQTKLWECCQSKG